jgi:hypothetical protein
MTKTEKALRLLESGEWITSTQLVEAGCGYRFGGRLQDLRNKGYTIEKRRVQGTLWAYRLAGQPPERERSEPPQRAKTPGDGPAPGGPDPSPAPLFDAGPPPKSPLAGFIDLDQRED